MSCFCSMICHLHRNWDKLYFKSNECNLLSIEPLQFWPPMILVLILNSYAVWRSNWYFHINFCQICEHFCQLLELLKIASLTMEVKHFGTFPVILVKLATSPLRWAPTPKNVEFWAQWVEMSPFDVTTLSGVGGGGGGVGGMKRWTQSRSKNNIVVRNRVLYITWKGSSTAVVDPEEGPGGPGPPLFLDQTKAWRAEKIWGGHPFPPSSLM